MNKINYSFDNVFLDYNYTQIFTELCKKNNLIQKTFQGYTEKYEGIPLIGEKKLLRTMVLYDKIDFASSVYDCSILIDKGFVAEKSICSSDIEPEIQQETEAVTIMSAYKKDIIRLLKKDFKENLKVLQDPQYPETADLWKNIINTNDILYNIYVSKNKKLNLKDDYNTILENLDTLSCSGSFEETFLRNYIIDQINSLIGIRHNIAYSIMASKKFNSIYMCDFLNGHNKLHPVMPEENTYAFIKTRLPDEVNILPMPQTIDDVFRMRKHPSLKAFRKVLNEWNYYINNDDVKAAQKIKKDIVSANHELEKLGKVKKFINSPITRTGLFLFGFIIDLGLKNSFLSGVLNTIDYVEPSITTGLTNKFSWTHINDK